MTEDELSQLIAYDLRIEDLQKNIIPQIQAKILDLQKPIPALQARIAAIPDELKDFKELKKTAEDMLYSIPANKDRGSYEQVPTGDFLGDIFGSTTGKWLPNKNVGGWNTLVRKVKPLLTKLLPNKSYPAIQEIDQWGPESHGVEFLDALRSACNQIIGDCYPILTLDQEKADRQKDLADVQKLVADQQKILDDTQKELDQTIAQRIQFAKDHPDANQPPMPVITNPKTKPNSTPKPRVTATTGSKYILYGSIAGGVILLIIICIAAFSTKVQPTKIA